MNGYTKEFAFARKKRINYRLYNTYICMWHINRYTYTLKHFARAYALTHTHTQHASVCVYV